MGPNLNFQNRNEKGQTLPLASLCVVTLLVAAALSVDIGALAAKNRRLQSVADLAAIDGSRELNGLRCDATYNLPSDLPTGSVSSQYDHVRVAVLASAARNGFVVAGAKTLLLELGVVSRNGSGVPTFTALSSCSSAVIPDSIRIHAGDFTAFSFGRAIGQNGRNSSRSGVGTRAGAGTLDGEGEFILGSALATFDASRSALLNPILSQMLCRAPTPSCSLSLSAVSYQGLANAQLTYGALATQLGFGTTSQLLNANLTIDQILGAAATLAGPSTIAGLALTGPAGISTVVTGTQTLKLLGMVTAAVATGNEAADVEFNLFQLVTGTAAIANGTNAVSIPNTAVTIPGVASITASISLIEPPVIIGSRAGATRTTKQLSVTVNPVLSLGTPSLAGLSLASVTGTLPITVTAGTATGTLTRVRCGANRGLDASVSVNAATLAVAGSLTVTLGTSTGPNGGILDALISSLLNVLGGQVLSTTLSVSGSGVSTTVGTTSLAFAFPAGFGLAGSQHVGNTTVGLGNLTYGTSNLALNVPLLSLLGIPLGTSLVNIPISSAALLGLLSPVLTSIDTLLIKPLMQTLGLDLGAADVTAQSINCGVPGLAG